MKPNTLVLAVWSEIKTEILKSCTKLLTYARVRGGPVAINDLSVLVHKEFSKVPFNELPERPALFSLEVLPERMSLLTVDLYFTRQVPLNFVAVCKGSDVRL